jgi:hypothetical protein
MKWSYKMGVNMRHLYQKSSRRLSAKDFVQQEHRAFRTRERMRRLQTSEAKDANSGSSPKTLNWCSENNPLKKNICTAIKSQNKCGSCWAFAATDAIETAVAVATKLDPKELSPQQFLECSKREMTETFTYCWAKSGVNGAPWLKEEMRWGSQNNGCDGGMTHGAFADAAQMQLGLLTKIELPYREDGEKLDVSAFNSSASCGRKPENAAASITGWEQVVGKDCTKETNPTELLKQALQRQPISVAINSGDQFKDYKGGIYECPNNGDFKDSSQIDHAVVLVGYDKDESSGEYWILKNSYTPNWGEKGFLKLRMDEKINCGISIFPVIPLGAQPGASNVTVDGGGEKIFVGMSPSTWIVVAVFVTVASLSATTVGVLFAKRRRASMLQS